MITDLVQISRLGEKQRPENLRLRMHLKRRNFHERRLKAIAQNIEDQTDCTTCANCCKVATVSIAEREVPKLARHLRVTPARFLADYTTQSEEEGLILKRNEQGCVFLDGNICTIYDERPRQCQHFPHLVSGEGSLVNRMWAMVDRACYCPIVYNTLEAWKVEVGFE